MKKILLIEDDIALNETTTEYLSISGYEVISTLSGAEGITKAMSEHPDIIICDITMPGINGYDVYKTLQSNWATSDIPFIFLTAMVDKKDVRHGMLLGADDYITKPCNFDDLLLSINTRLQKKEQRKKLTEESFNVLLQNSQNGVIICNDKFEIIKVNNKITERTAILEYQLLNNKIENILSSDNFDINDKLSFCLKGVQYLKFDCQLKLAEGSVPINITANSTIYNNRTVLILTVFEQVEASTTNTKIEISDAVNIISNNKDDISQDLLDELKIIFDSKQKNSNDQIDYKLTKRELEVLSFVCKGLSNNEIADKLYISYRTVERHRTNLINKTNSKNIIDVVILAIKNNWIKL